MKKRLLAKFRSLPRLDEFDLQIRFEGWVQKFPHIQELYNQKKLIIGFDEKENFLIETRMSDRQFILWCLKYPNTPAGNQLL